MPPSYPKHTPPVFKRAQTCPSTATVHVDTPAIFSEESRRPTYASSNLGALFTNTGKSPPSLNINRPSPQKLGSSSKSDLTLLIPIMAVKHTFDETGDIENAAEVMQALTGNPLHSLQVAINKLEEVETKLDEMTAKYDILSRTTQEALRRMDEIEEQGGKYDERTKTAAEATHVLNGIFEELQDKMVGVENRQAEMEGEIKRLGILLEKNRNVRPKDGKSRG